MVSLRRVGFVNGLQPRMIGAGARGADMLRGLRAFVLLISLVLPAGSSQPAIPSLAPRGAGGESQCRLLPLGARPAEAATAESNCCRFAGGVCGCRAGLAVCCKDQVLSSCPCGGAAARPGPPSAFRGGAPENPVLQLRDLVFADQETSWPLGSGTAFRAGQRLWVWVDLQCPAACQNQLASFGEREIRLSVYWYFDPGGGPILHEDRKAERVLRRDASPLQAAIPAVLSAGNWIAEVGYGPDRVCTRDEKCSFRVRVGQ